MGGPDVFESRARPFRTAKRTIEFADAVSGETENTGESPVPDPSGDKVGDVTHEVILLFGMDGPFSYHEWRGEQTAQREEFSLAI